MLLFLNRNRKLSVIMNCTTVHLPIVHVEGCCVTVTAKLSAELLFEPVAELVAYRSLTSILEARSKHSNHINFAYLGH